MAETPTPENAGVTPELVRKIADRVYALLVADLRRDRERSRRRPLNRRNK